MTLYEIDAEILDCIDQTTGEILDESLLAALQMERRDKIRHIACYVKNLRADAAAYKAEAEAFKERKEAAEKKAASLEAYLKRQLDGQSVKEREFEITWKKSKAADIPDESLIPAEWWEPQAPKLMKGEIRKALMRGATIPGATLIERDNMTLK